MPITTTDQRSQPDPNPHKHSKPKKPKNPKNNSTNKTINKKDIILMSDFANT